MKPLTQNSGSLRICLSGGGTGGHLFPAIAIADALKMKYPSSEILFVGAKGKMEMQKVPDAGYDIKGLWISGFQRKNLAKNLLLPFKVIGSLLKSFNILRKFKPNVVIGTGGYASAPLLYMAALKGIPTLIQEQNFFPGITNKILGPKVDKVCVVFEGMERYFPKEKIIVTGNPVRKTLLETTIPRVQAREAFKLDKEKFTILILGGSLGAGSINEGVARSVERIGEHNAQLIWQTGKFDFTRLKEKFSGHKNISIHDFIKNMGEAYAAADLIICRAGAITLAEIALLGKAAILIPSPNVAEDHQTQNALVLVKENAALIIPDKEVNEALPLKLEELLINTGQLGLLEENIRKFGMPDATGKIVDAIELLIKKDAGTI